MRKGPNSSGVRWRFVKKIAFALIASLALAWLAAVFLIGTEIDPIKEAEAEADLKGGHLLRGAGDVFAYVVW